MPPAPLDYNKCKIESVDKNSGGAETCFITKFNPKRELHPVNGFYDLELSENPLYTSITTDKSPDVSEGNTCHENTMLVRDQEECFLTHHHSSFCTTKDDTVQKSECHTIFKTKNYLNASFWNNCEKSDKNHGASGRRENQLKAEESCTMEEQRDYPEAIHTGLHTHIKYTSLHPRDNLEVNEEDEEMGDRCKDSVLQNENALYLFESMGNIEDGMINDHNAIREFNYGSLNKYVGLANDKCDDLRRKNTNEHKATKSDCLTVRFTERVVPENKKLSLTNNFVMLDSMDSNQKNQIHVNDPSDLRISQMKRKSSEKYFSGNISHVQETRLDTTPLQNNTFRHHSPLKRNTQSTLAVTTTPIKKIPLITEPELAVESPHKINNNKVVTRKQALQVIDLSFGKRILHTEKSKTKPVLATFRNVWKTSNLFREKKREEKNERGSLTHSARFSLVGHR